jgi:hypothetical protein
MLIKTDRHCYGIAGLKQIQGLAATLSSSSSTSSSSRSFALSSSLVRASIIKSLLIPITSPLVIPGQTAAFEEVACHSLPEQNYADYTAMPNFLQNFSR